MNTKAFFKISYGVYIVCSISKEEKLNGQIANTVFQVTSEPAKFAVSINRDNLTHKYIEESGVFSVSVLKKDVPIPFIGKFGFKTGKDTDKFKDTEFIRGHKGVPVVKENSVAYIECEVENSINLGTHTLFIGKVVNAEVLSEDEVMTYAYYHEVKKGKSPKNAPTFIKENKEEKKTIQGGTLEKYRCKVCSYIYDPEKGDPDNGIEPGTKFEDIPDDWVCPVCGVGKEEFEKISE